MIANTDQYAVTDTGDLLWSSVLDALRAKLSTRRLEEIELDSVAVERTGSSLRVTVRGSSLRPWIQDGRLSLLDATVTALSDGGAELAVLPVANPEDGLGRDPTRSLSRFVASAANQPAFTCARSFADGAPSQRSVLLHGPPGSGKTHLLHGAARQLRAAGHGVLLCSAERLSLELVEAMRRDEVALLRERLRDCQTLLVDDVHTLAGREATQEELAGIITARAAAGAPFLLSTRLDPSADSELEPALVAALLSGQTLSLRAPEWETRVAAILERIALWQVETTAEVATFLARSLGASLSRLDTVLTRLMTHPACAGGLLDAELIQRVLETGGPLLASARPQEVIRLVSQHFGVRPAELHSKARSPRVTTPRQLAMYLMRHHCGLSYPEIGQRLRRHHTTAIHACRQIEKRRDRDSSLRAAVLVLEKELLRQPERDQRRDPSPTRGDRSGG